MKVRLEAQRDSHIATGVYAASNHSTTYSEVTVTTSGVDATTALRVGVRLYRGDGEQYGKVTSIDSATQFKFFMLYYIPIVSGEQFYVPALDTFELDLQKEPNISINYQFDDVKNPDKTKGSFSQTFKLPFTDNNNKFFQDWYNVNLDTLVFSTKEEYDASVYVGTVSQFDGILQLKAVYQKGQYYEVVVFSKVSTLFSLIGDDSLRDAFLNNAGTYYNTSLNHVFNYTQMKNSWEGSSSAFVNASDPAVSLKDPDHNIQKVMYPMSVTRRRFYFKDDSDGWYLGKDQDALDDSQAYTVPITQFRPAIQLKEMIKIILGKIGLSYTSNFIDSEYFSKIFMTTGGHLAGSPVPILEDSTTVVTDGQVIVGYAEDSSWGMMGTEAAPLTYEEQEQYQFDEDENYTLQYALIPDTVVANDGDLYDADKNYFIKAHPTQNYMTIKHRIETARIQRVIDDEASNECGFTFTITLYRCNSDGSLYVNAAGNNVYVAPIITKHMAGPDVSNCVSWHKEWCEHTIDISNVYQGRKFRPVVRVSEFYMMSANPYNTYAGLSLGMPCTGDCGDDDPILTCATGSSLDCLSTVITMNYDGYDLGEYDATRDVPACIDPELKQKDFFKDLIQRFNLVVTTNPNDPSNIVIEPYDTYLGSGTIRHWTDKLDLSKEVLVKDTSSLQKQHISFTDKEDIDLYNKEIATRHEWANVYGHLEITETNNNWAKGELKNEPMFAPYINGWPFKGSTGTQGYQTEEVAGTDLHNMAIQYEFSYNDDDNEIDIDYEKTQPKLFWYNGSPTAIQNNYGTAKTIYMHDYAVTGWTAFSFTEYPLCSPYELTPDATTNESTIGATTRSLYWDSWATPFIPDCTVFNWTEETPTNWNYTLYGYYWHAYLSSLHHPESRLMDCYLNLNAVDIFNFEFNDEIFIKDSYWRILKIHNYQVGVKASTKVTLIKVVDTLIGSDCGYSISDTGLFANTYLTWCPNTDTDCTPDVLSWAQPGLFVPQDCCYSRGGTPRFASQGTADAYGYTNGELPCIAYQGSLPISKKMLSTNISIRNIQGIKSMGKRALLAGTNNFSVGSGKTKGALPIMLPIKDDISIKYTTEINKDDVIQLTGESHRIVLTGQTIGGVTSYAYPQGSSDNPSISLPNNSNVMIRVNAISTVTGGDDVSYPVGYTESMAYYTAFKMLNNTGTQIGTAGGVQEFAIAESAVRGSLAITLDTTEGQKNRVLFGLVDGLGGTVQRVWALTVDFHIQIIPSLGAPLDTKDALYQDFSYIQLQNFRNLLWN